jgi:hypothetical protein
MIGKAGHSFHKVCSYILLSIVTLLMVFEALLSATYVSEDAGDFRKSVLDSVSRQPGNSILLAGLLVWGIALIWLGAFVGGREAGQIANNRLHVSLRSGCKLFFLLSSTVPCLWSGLRSNESYRKGVGPKGCHIRVSLQSSMPQPTRPETSSPGPFQSLVPSCLPFSSSQIQSRPPTAIVCSPGPALPPPNLSSRLAESKSNLRAARSLLRMTSTSSQEFVPGRRTAGSDSAASRASGAMPGKILPMPSAAISPTPPSRTC